MWLSHAIADAGRGGREMEVEWAGATKEGQERLREGHATVGEALFYTEHVDQNLKCTTGTLANIANMELDST